jgi:DNA mismatch repair ATPase MutS
MCIYDRILTRIGSDDDFQSSASTFTLEMRETAMIMETLTEKTLLIIDELGRGTSPNEGLALTTAICESLQKSMVS